MEDTARTAPRVVGGSAKDVQKPVPAGGFAKAAGRIAAVAGVIYLIGSLIDNGILWILQRQEGIQWEFVALTRTAENFPDVIVATGLLYLGLESMGRLRVWSNRLMASWVLLLGLIALGMLALTVLNWIGIQSAVNPDAQDVVRQSFIKTSSLTTLYALLLIPAGILGFRVGTR